MFTGGFIILITSTPLILRNKDKMTTSNELVWPSEASGLSKYICQFSSHWWPPEAAGYIVCLCVWGQKAGLQHVGDITTGGGWGGNCLKLQEFRENKGNVEMLMHGLCSNERTVILRGFYGYVYVLICILPLVSADSSTNEWFMWCFVGSTKIRRLLNLYCKIVGGVYAVCKASLPSVWEVICLSLQVTWKWNKTPPHNSLERFAAQIQLQHNRAALSDCRFRVF